MKDLRRILATAMTLCLLTASAFAFDQRKEKPPPKPEKEVPKVEKKDPPRNDGGNRGGREGKKGKP
jgi:hypothetical protein